MLLNSPTYESCCVFTTFSAHWLVSVPFPGYILRQHHSPATHSRALITSILPESFTLLFAIGKGKLPISFSLAIHKFPIIYITVRPGIYALAMASAVIELSIVNPSIMPFISTLAVALMQFKISLVRISIGHDSPTISIPTTMAPNERNETHQSETTVR
jgi:hypothetical protein